MWASFKYSLLQLVRVPGVLIWTLVFPIVLGSLFVMMFGALDERAEAVSVNVIVVDEEQAKGEERSALSFENIARSAQAGARYLHGSARRRRRCSLQHHLRVFA